MSENKEVDYEKDMSIDEDALDVELLEQPRLTYKYNKILAKREQELSNTKDSLNLIKADLDKKYRSNPEKYGIEKVTDASITAAIQRDKDYQEANQEVIDAQYEYMIAKGAVDAISNQRKSALENLVKLHGMNYFAGPVVPRNLHQEREKKQERNDARINETMSRRRK